MSREEKQGISPEVYQYKWFGIGEAVDVMLGSMQPGVFINDFQRRSFQEHGINHRDPMFITAFILASVERHKDSDSIIAHSTDAKSLLERAVWLHDGMSNEEVQEAFMRRKRRDSIIKQIHEERVERLSKI